MNSDVRAIISSACRAVGLYDEDAVSTCCDVYAELTRAGTSLDGRDGAPTFSELSVLSSLLAVIQHTAREEGTTCRNVAGEADDTRRDVGSLAWLREATRERLLHFTAPAAPSVWHIASRNYEEATRVKKALLEVIEEVNPKNVLLDVQAVDVCRVCKSAEFITQTAEQTRSADEPAVWIFRCSNPIHAQPVVW